LFLRHWGWFSFLWSGVTVTVFFSDFFGEVWLCHAYMMLQFQGVSRHCNLLAVLSGKSHDSKQKQKQKQDDVSEGQFSSYPFPELSSSGHLEVTTLFLFVCIFFLWFCWFLESFNLEWNFNFWCDFRLKYWLNLLTMNLVEF
jgi:hypothetical protein